MGAAPCAGFAAGKGTELLCGLGLSSAVQKPFRKKTQGTADGITAAETQVMHTWDLNPAFRGLL